MVSDSVAGESEVSSRLRAIVSIATEKLAGQGAGLSWHRYRLSDMKEERLCQQHGFCEVRQLPAAFGKTSR